DQAAPVGETWEPCRQHCQAHRRNDGACACGAGPCLCDEGVGGPTATLAAPQAKGSCFSDRTHAKRSVSLSKRRGSPGTSNSLGTGPGSSEDYGLERLLQNSRLRNCNCT